MNDKDGCCKVRAQTLPKIPTLAAVDWPLMIYASVTTSKNKKLTFHRVFANFSNFFSKIYSVSIELRLKFVQIFILVYLKIFLQVSKVFLNFFFFNTHIIFFTELSVISSVLIIYIVLRKTYLQKFQSFQILFQNFTNFI